MSEPTSNPYLAALQPELLEDVGPLPDDLRVAYDAALTCAEIASAIQTFLSAASFMAASHIPGQAFGRVLGFLPKDKDVRPKVQAVVAELNAIRGGPYIFGDFFGPNAHTVALNLGNDLRREAWKVAKASRLVPDCQVYEDFDPATLQEYGEVVRSHFKALTFPDARMLISEIQVEASKAAMRRCTLPAKTPSPANPPKGKPGRRGYPDAAWDYATELRRKNPAMKAHTLRQQCLKRFSEDDLPPDGEAFRRWLNRKRANRAN